MSRKDGGSLGPDGEQVQLVEIERDVGEGVLLRTRSKERFRWWRNLKLIGKQHTMNGVVLGGWAVDGG